MLNREISYNIEPDLHIYPEIIGSKGDLKFVEGPRQKKKKLDAVGRRSKKEAK